MDSENEELYLQKLQEFVLDEEKIVTTIWLCMKLKLDISTSEKLLQSFMKDHRSTKPSELASTHILSGVLSKDGSHCVALVKEDELADKKKLFSEHSESVYSVQKCKGIDLNTISMVDMFDFNSSIAESIVGKNCVKRKLKVKKVLVAPPRSGPSDKSKASHLFNTAVIKEENKESMQLKKETSPPVRKATEPAKNDSATKAPSKAGGITSFFAKISPKVNEQEKTSPKEEKVKLEDVKQEEQMEVDEPVEKSKPSSLYDSGTDEEAKKLEEKNKSNKKKPAKKTPAKRQRKASDERPQKRRKRIVQRNDSDSDDMFGGNSANEDNDVVSSDDEPVYKNPTPPLVPKNKRRKLVDKTYEDEDGYIVTKKEWVVESASDEESEQKEQKDPQLINKKDSVKKEKIVVKKESPVKGKGKKNLKPASNQASIMSFFKKK